MITDNEGQITTMAYDKLGRELQTVLPNGITTVQTDADGQLIRN